ncbi:MAG: phosphotransferase, partial [Chloroflexota bacterium]|nr:phosphotransferase [Chloroflexota bacterium]
MLDIVAFANAMRQGSVSFLRPLGLRPLEDASGEIVSFRDDDAIVFPMARSDDRPEFALRIPLDDASSRQWPALYADLASTVGAIQAHLPAEITILDVEGIPGTEVALLYDWVPGETLTHRVTRSHVRHEREQLDNLLWPLADIAEALRLGNMVHGDIAPGNIIVRPDGGMTLIDLDRMGHREEPITPRRRPGYRIPRGGGDPVEEDAFGLLVLMASCGILADISVPIDHERAPESSHPMLLFSSWDLMDPRRSRLVREIEGELTALSVRLLDLLVEACTGPPDRTPSLLHEAVRAVRRSVSPPDTSKAYGAESGWHVIPAAPRDNQGRALVHKEPDDRAPAEEGHRSAASWPEAAPRARAQAEATQAGHPADEGVAVERATGTLDWQPTTRLVDMLQGLGERGVAIDRSAKRGRRAEQRRQMVATELREALAHNDRETLVRLAMSGSLAELGESSRSDLLQVVRALSHETISRAIASDDDGMIVAAVDETVFERDTDLDPIFRERIRLARSRLRWTDAVVEAIRTGDADSCA